MARQDGRPTADEHIRSYEQYIRLVPAPSPGNAQHHLRDVRRIP